MPGYELVGVCEPVQSELLSKADFVGLARLERDAMLGDPSIEMVAVEADVQHGLAYAHEAIAAGKHVHLDKPPGEDLESLRRLFDEAKKRSLAVQMGYMWRYHIAMSEAIRMARGGELGNVYAVRATINKPISPEERKQLARFRGGMMFELGCHMIDRVVDLLGKPRHVTGWLRHDGSLDDGLADNTLAVLECDNGLGEVYIAAMQPHGNSYRTFQILGTQGTATVRPFAPDGGLYVDTADAEGERKIPLSIPKWRGPYEPDFTMLARIIRKGEAPDYAAEHDLAVQETLLRACHVL
jgi:predicted dehydrogenase